MYKVYNVKFKKIETILKSTRTYSDSARNKCALCGCARELECSALLCINVDTE